VRLRNPHLPQFLQEVTLRNVTLGDASTDLAVRGNGGDVAVRVLATHGDIEVSVVYAGLHS
jgi:hypothetical protein